MSVNGKMLVLTLIAVPFVSVAMLAPASAKMTRNEAVTACVKQAQTQVPTMDAEGSGEKHRIAIYSSCMHKDGFRP